MLLRIPSARRSMSETEEKMPPALKQSVKATASKYLTYESKTARVAFQVGSSTGMKRSSVGGVLST